MGNDEKVLGITLKARADMAEASRVVKDSLAAMDKEMGATADGIKKKSEAAFDKVAKDAKDASAKGTKSLTEMLSQSGEKMEKIQQVGMVAFGAVAAAIGIAVAAAADAKEFEAIKNTFKTTAAEVGSAFLPVIKDAANALAGAVKWFGEFARENQTVVRVVGFTALAVTGLVFAFGTLAKTAVMVAKAIEGVKIAMDLLQKNPWIAVFTISLLLLMPLVTMLITNLTSVESSAQGAAGGVNQATQNIDDMTAALDVNSSSLSRFDQMLQAIASAPTIGELNDQLRALNLMLAETGDPGKQAAIQEQMDSVFNSLRKIYGLNVSEGAKNAEKVQFNAQAFRDLMNAGYSAVDALKLMNSQMLIMGEQTIEVPKAEQFGPAFDINIMRDIAQGRIDDENRVRDNFIESTAAMRAAYFTFTDSLLQNDMTGKQRREAMWESFKSVVLRQTAQATFAVISGEKLKQGAILQTVAVGIAATARAVAMDVAAAAKSVLAWMKVTFAKLTAFFGFLGPFAPVAAAGVVGAAFGLMSSLFSNLKMQRGGIVPGSGSGDTVPAWLTPGEGIIRKDVVQQNPGLVPALNSGRGVGNRTINITVNSDRKLSMFDMREIELMIERKLPELLENIVERRLMKPGFKFA